MKKSSAIFRRNICGCLNVASDVLAVLHVIGFVYTRIMSPLWIPSANPELAVE